MRPAAIVAASVLLAAVGTARNARADVHVEVRVTEEIGHAAFVEFSPSQGAWVALYGSFSDGSLRTLVPVDAEASAEWIPANEVRTITVELVDGLRLESVQAVASRRWFDPRQLWIAGTVSSASSGGLWA